MKKLIFSLVLMSTSFMMTSSALADGDLEITGFSIVKNTQTALKLSFRNEIIFTISKQRFTDQGSAEKFCLGQKSHLDKDFKVLLIAMSGATNINKFLNDTISFKFSRNGRVISGIWAWSAKDNKVTLMYDGRGTATEDIPFEQLSSVVSAAIPAVCVQTLIH